MMGYRAGQWIPVYQCEGCKIVRWFAPPHLELCVNCGAIGRFHLAAGKLQEQRVQRRWWPDEVSLVVSEVLMTNDDKTEGRGELSH